jgi:hypothetical protein
MNHSIYYKPNSAVPLASKKIFWTTLNPILLKIMVLSTISIVPLNFSQTY